MDKKMDLPEPNRLPSPEELFQDNKVKDNRVNEQSVPVRRREPIPTYKVIRFFTKGFIIALLIVALAGIGMHYYNVHFYYMKSSSMENRIPQGSLILSWKTSADELQVGDIITYINGDGISVTHEIVQIEERYGEKVFTTKGSENQSPDPEVVTQDMIEGKVILTF